ncbi:endonuclease/exonuclease/phosphatase family protein [Spongiimicrobium salis]|uniref:endonuclease/exonuclease/phosphatase family protein n=1 Tax=Spongiimicrobium salis TaxID=1667022 RepID=UPI00374D3C37
MSNTKYTIAFYNLENLFDVEEDPNTLDDDFTPDGFKKWSKKRLHKKLQKLGKTIAEIGFKETEKLPSLVGVAEVENDTVLEDLLKTEGMRKGNYDFVHYDSPDERGIDTALIYNKEHFEVLDSEPIVLYVNNPDGERDNTRDILYVHGRLNGEEVHIFVNHWPSRRDGDKETAYKRIEAAATIGRFMDRLEEQYADPNYIVMGDFNDDPKSESIQKLLERDRLFNPMEKMLSPDRGSASYRRQWSLFDQIIISHNFFNIQKDTHSFTEADIFDQGFLMERKGKYKGAPYRTFAGRKYLGGYSDHFPVFIQVKFHQ